MTYLTWVTFVRSPDAVTSYLVLSVVSIMVSFYFISLWQCFGVEKVDQTPRFDITLDQMWNLYHHDNLTLFSQGKEKSKLTSKVSKNEVLFMEVHQTYSRTHVESNRRAGSGGRTAPLTFKARRLSKTVHGKETSVKLHSHGILENLWMGSLHQTNFVTRACFHL
jgi:hypothetical protein